MAISKESGEERAWWRSSVLKKWSALGPWLERRLRVLLTRSGVHWMVGSCRVWVRVCGSELRMSLAKVASRGGGVVVRWWNWRKKWGFGG